MNKSTIPQGTTSTISNLVEEILKHKRLYYAGRPEISDDSYDEIENKLRSLDPNHPALSIVGTDSEDFNIQKIPHETPMLSLEKTYDLNALSSWIGQELILGSVKLDGSSLSLIYKDGELKTAKTRGNGREGENVIAKALWVSDIPKTVESKEDFEVRGELCCSQTQFEVIALEMSKLGLQPPTSARNIVAGILGRKIHIDLARYFNFFAFEVLGKKDLTSEVKKIEFLNRNRFNVPKHSLIHSPIELTNFLEMVKNEMANGDVGCDGAVFTINDSTRHQALGFTNHHPKYKLSFKWQGQTAVSKVIRVDWATSKFGIVTPVAIIDPVVLSGATITNVTLHNASYVRSLDLKAGDKIEIVRSGEVIPKFLKIIERSVGDIDIPKVCPSCRSILVEDEVRLRCSNAQNCPAQLSGTILNWINAVGIDDLSEKRLLAMIEIGIVSDIPSLYKISIDDILKLPATKDKMASKIFANIQKSKNMPLSVFLHGLGIEGIGLSTWEKIVERFGSIDKVKSACEDDLLAIDGIASKTALQIISGIQKNTHLIHQLFSVGVLITENSRAERIGTQIFNNMNFVITGTLSKPRKDIENLIKSLGGKITSSVTKNTNVLITNDTETQSSKMQMASKLCIPIWTEFEFFQKTET